VSDTWLSAVGGGGGGVVRGESLRNSHLLGNRAFQYKFFLKEFSPYRKKENRTLWLLCGLTGPNEYAVLESCAAFLFFISLRTHLQLLVRLH